MAAPLHIIMPRLNVRTHVGSVAIILLVALYFLPTILAKRLHLKDASSIFCVNLVFGWTVLGWILALTLGNSSMECIALICDSHCQVKLRPPALLSAYHEIIDYQDFFGVTAFAALIRGSYRQSIFLPILSCVLRLVSLS
jgi:Superinfection immunity protein